MKKASHKGHTFYYPIYMKCPGEKDSVRAENRLGLDSAGELGNNEKWLQMVLWFLLGEASVIKMFWNQL